MQHHWGNITFALFMLYKCIFIVQMYKDTRIRIIFFTHSHILPWIEDKGAKLMRKKDSCLSQCYGRWILTFAGFLNFVTCPCPSCSAPQSIPTFAFAFGSPNSHYSRQACFNIMIRCVWGYTMILSKLFNGPKRAIRTGNG